MPTNKPRTKLIIDDALKQEIELYQQRTGIKVQSKAIVELIARGAKATLASLEPSRIFSSEELLLLDCYRASDPGTCKKALALLSASAWKNDCKYQKSVPTAGYNLITVMQLFDAADAQTQAAVVAMLEASLISTIKNVPEPSDADQDITEALNKKITGAPVEDASESVP